MADGLDPGAPGSTGRDASTGRTGSTGPATAQALATAYRAGTTDPVAELDACLGRIGALDGQLGAVLTTDPRALDAARVSARRLRAGRPRSALEGVPVLLKDNIDTAGFPTTAGSRLLSGVPSPVADAPLVARLRRAGAVVVGKANLSEWSNFRSTTSTSGWSGVGGQTRNPHVLDRDPSGSSAGSAAAVAAGYTPVAVGTETDGSILSPGAHCGIVGMKPTLGLVSRTGVVPISSAQDTAGPLARTVPDAAALLAVLAGVDRADPATATAAVRRARREVRLLVGSGALERGASGGGDGRRLAVWRRGPQTGSGADAAGEVFEDVVRRVRDRGFVPVEVEGPPVAMLGDAWTALLSEFRIDLDGYLAGRGGAPTDLAAVVAGNEADPLELSRFGQELMVAALAAPRPDDPDVREARRRARAAARGWVDGWAGACVACVTSAGPAALPLTWADERAPTTTPGGQAAEVPTAGGVTVTAVAAASPAAIAGTPSITFPVGSDGPLPLGLVVLGTPFGDAGLLALAAELELLVGHRIDPALLPHAP